MATLRLKAMPPNSTQKPDNPITLVAANGAPGILWPNCLLLANMGAKKKIDKSGTLCYTI